MKSLKSEYRKYSKMYFDAVYRLCYFRYKNDYFKTHRYDSWCFYFTSEVKLLHKLRLNIWNQLFDSKSDLDYCKDVSDSFRDDLFVKLQKNGIDLGYYYQL